MSNQTVDTPDDTLMGYRRRFEHLRRAADMVRESLREAILDGQFPAGSRLREEELARGLGVSRTPVREALQQLAADGLVEISPHQGSIVAPLTVDDILSLYVVREALEGAAARLAARRATPAQCDELLALVADMESIADTRDAAAIAELNLQFHAAIRRAARNRYLDRFLSQIEHAVRRSGQTTFSYPGRAQTTVGEHRAIVEAIIAHDPERAEALAVDHMRRARQLRLQMLAEDQ